MSWKKFAKEGRAIARQVGLLLEDRGETYQPGSSPILFFLHGLYATAGEFRPLRSYCEETLGLATAAYNHMPGVGVAALGQQAASWVERINKGTEYFLVGHSLGALAWAYAHQNNLLPEGCLGTLALAAPLMGASAPQLAPSQARRDLHAQSPVLVALRRDWASLPIYWVEAKNDLLVEPWRGISAGQLPEFRPHAAIHECWDGVGHNGILFDPRTTGLLKHLLDKKRQETACDSEEIKL